MFGRTVKAPRERIFVTPTNRRNDFDAVVLPITGDPVFPIMVVDVYRCREIIVNREVWSKHCLKPLHEIDVKIGILPDALELVVIEIKNGRYTPRESLLPWRN